MEHNPVIINNLKEMRDYFLRQGKNITQEERALGIIVDNIIHAIKNNSETLYLFYSINYRRFEQDAIYVNKISEYFSDEKTPLIEDELPKKEQTLKDKEMLGDLGIGEEFEN